MALPHGRLSGLIKSEKAWEMHMGRPTASGHHYHQLTDSFPGSKTFPKSTVLALTHLLSSILPCLARFSGRTQKLHISVLFISFFGD